MSEIVQEHETVFSFEAKRLSGVLECLADYRGQVLLIVNTASKCGFTNQYAGLENIYQEYKEQGFSVFGFPCNQFGAQEPGTQEEIKSFCQLNYGVTFPLFDKINVNGAEVHPLFAYLKKSARGVMGTEGIKWNFTKFLVGRDGLVVERYGPQSKPESLKADIEKLL